MRILILGASGMLGRSVSQAFESCDHECIAHSNTTESDEYVRANLLESKEAAHFLNQHSSDVIINLVALTNVDACETNPDLALRLNAGIPEMLSQVVAPEARVIHVSTDHVYNGKFATPNKETDIQLTNVYAQTKRSGELPILAREGVVLRTNFFGPSATSGRLSFSDAIRNALAVGAPFSGFDDVYFNPLSMTRLSKEIVRVATSWHPGLYNLGAKTGMSKFNFAKQTAQAYGFDPSNIGSSSLINAGLAAARPLGMVTDVSLFESTYEVTLPLLEEEIFRLEPYDD